MVGGVGGVDVEWIGWLISAPIIIGLGGIVGRTISMSMDASWSTSTNKDCSTYL